MSFKQLVCIFSVICLSYSFFDPGTTPVTLLDGTNFDKEVVQSDDIWLVLFYAPWCGHCQAFSPEYERAARALKGIFKIGAIDADKERSVSGKYGIRGFPTVKFFGTDKEKPEEYNSARKAESIIEFMIEKVKTITNERLNGKNTNANSDNNSGNQQQKQQEQQ